MCVCTCVCVVGVHEGQCTEVIGDGICPPPSLSILRQDLSLDLELDLKLASFSSPPVFVSSRLTSPCDHASLFTSGL